MGRICKILASANWFELLLRLLLCIRAVQIVAQPDFISIDCGAAWEKNQTDSNGITWTNDGKFILSGYGSGNISTPQGNWLVQLYNFKYFTEPRSKFCYELPVKMNKTYLLRAGFLWGNFTDLSKGPVKFDVFVMSTFWTTVEISSVADFKSDLKDGVTAPLTKEIIVRSTSSVMNVCLVRETGFPFINSLELRPLEDGMYSVVTQQKVLVNQWRWTAGKCCLVTPRYPIDPYDRIWYQYDDKLRWGNTKVAGSVIIEKFNNSLDIIENQTELARMDGFDRPPLEVMMDAWAVNDSLVMHFPIDGKSSEYYIALYFQELLKVKNGSRNFNILLEEELLDNIRTTANGIEFIKLKNISGTWANFTLRKQNPWNPILNAAEMYGVLNANSSTTDPQDVSSVNTIQARLGLVDWSGDPCFPVPWDWISCNHIQPSRVTAVKLTNFSLGGSIPLEFGNLTELTHLWLDTNRFTGLIPDFSKLLKLKTLHLQNNNLKGAIPSYLSNLPELQEVFLDNNTLSGVVPESLLALANSSDRNFTLTFSGNSLCLPGDETCDSQSDSPSQKPISSSTKGLGTLRFTLVVAFPVGTLVILAAVLWWYFHKRKAKEFTAQTPEDTSSQLQGLDLGFTRHARSYSYQEIELITSKFNRVLGSGSYGEVYHGTLSNGQEVAVKVNAVNSNQGAAEFATEVVLLSRVHHHYLMSLVGYCQEAGQQILIYVYMRNGSLGDLLHGKNSTRPLTWKRRLDIALRSAQGLEYLHTFCTPPIIHRDIKPNNILLDENMVAKLADFGLSKSEVEGSQSGISTGVKGTMGYLDPEYSSGLQRLNAKSDVYSFGVLLLELITGQKPTTVLQLPDGTELTLIARAQLVTSTSDISAFVDPVMGSGYNVEAVRKVLDLGLAAVEPRRIDRPDMGQIVHGLIEAIQVESSTDVEQVGKRKLKSVTFEGIIESNESPLRSQHIETNACWDPEFSSAYMPR